MKEVATWKGTREMDLLGHQDSAPQHGLEESSQIISKASHFLTYLHFGLISEMKGVQASFHLRACYTGEFQCGGAQGISPGAPKAKAAWCVCLKCGVSWLSGNSSSSPSKGCNPGEDPI